MTNLLTFPSQTAGRIPKPFNYTEGDSYSYVSFEQDAAFLIAVHPAAVYVIKDGDFCNGIIHAVNTAGGVVIARLTKRPDDTLEVESYHLGLASGVFPSAAVDVIGSVVEYWPLGWGGPCWVLNPQREASALPMAQASNQPRQNLPGFSP